MDNDYERTTSEEEIRESEERCADILGEEYSVYIDQLNQDIDFLDKQKRTNYHDE